jgi:diacylglycerol kinase family enzyme
VPHPRIEERRVSAVQIELDRPTPIYLDGELVGDGRTLSLRVEPDALTCVV